MIFPGHSDEGNSGNVIRRLLQQNRGLRLRLNSLASAIPDLETRVLRLENSVIFQFLRWLGARLAWSGIPLFQVARRLDRESGSRAEEYAEWARQAALFRRSLSELRAKSAGPGEGIRVSILIEARDTTARELD